MNWAGEFRQCGFYKLTIDDRTWELRWRKGSRTEPDGYYLYGPSGVDVIAEFMGAKLAAAQRAAVRRAYTYDPEAAKTLADSKASDALWDELITRESA